MFRILSLAGVTAVLLDYSVAIALIILPFVFGLGNSHPLALWLGVATGLSSFVLTRLTDHQLGVFKVLPYSFQLLVDFLVRVVFVIAPFALGFIGLDAWFYWANGATVLMVVSLHQPEEVHDSCSIRAAPAGG